MPVIEEEVNVEDPIFHVIEELRNIENQFNVFVPTKDESLNLLIVGLFGIPNTQDIGVMGRINGWFDKSTVARSFTVKPLIENMEAMVHNMRGLYNERETRSVEWVRALNTLAIEAVQHYTSLAHKYDEQIARYNEELNKLQTPFPELLKNGDFNQAIEDYFANNLPPRRQLELSRMYDAFQTIEEFANALVTNKELNFADKIYLRSVNIARRKFAGQQREQPMEAQSG